MGIAYDPLMSAKRKAPAIQDLPGYLAARDKTMANIAARAAQLSSEYTPRMQLHPSDVLTDPVLTYCALSMPLGDWHAADGVIRPKRWYHLRAQLRFVRAVYRAKRALDQALDRMAGHDAKAHHRRRSP